MRNKYTLIAGILTLLYAFYYWGIPSIINIDKRIDFVEQQIEQKTGYKINIDQPRIKMGLTPSVWLMAEDFSVLNNDNTKAVDVTHSAIELDLLPLPLGKVQIGNLSADNIDVNLVYTKDGKLQLGQYPITAMPKSKMVLSKAFVRTGNYNLKLDDLKRNKTVLLKGSYLSLDEFKKNKKLKMSTFAELFVNKKVSEIMMDIDIKLPITKISEDQFKINGHISDVNLKDFSDYVKAFPETGIESLSGKINMVADTTKTDKHKKIFSKLTISDLGIMFKEKNKSIFCKDTITIKTDAKTIKNGINIADLSVKTKGIDILVNGDVTKLDSKLPHVNTDIIINKSRTESFIPLLPGLEDISPAFNLAVLKENYFYGNISGKLSVKGKADTPDINGSILVDEGYLIRPLNAPKATIKLDFRGQDLLMDVEVPAPNNQKVFVKGTAELYGDMIADLMITSTDSVDLKTAQNVLNPLHQILKFEIGPVPIMDIKGIGNINLHVVGNHANPHTWGAFNFRNATASFLDIHNLTMTNGSGTLDFDDFDTHFYTKTAFYNNKPVSIDGTCNLKGHLNFDVIAKNQDLGNLLKIVQTSPMLTDIQAMLKPINSAKGKTDFAIKLTGDVIDVNDVVFNKNIFAKGNIKLYSDSIVAQGIPLTNISGDIDFDNLNTDFDLVSNLDNSNITINGKINDRNSNIKVASSKFVVKDGIKLLNLNLPYKNEIGKITTSFNAAYKGNIDKIDFNALSVIGKIYALKSNNLTVNNADYSVTRGNLKTSNIYGNFKNSPYSVQINDFNLNKKLLTGNFNFQNFNLSYLNEIKNYLGLKDFRDFSGILNFKGHVRNNEIISDINLNNLSTTYSPLNAHIRLDSGKLNFRNHNLNVNKVNATISEMPVFIDGRILNVIKNPNLNLTVAMKPSQEFVDQIYNNKAVYPIKIKGNVSLNANLNGTAKSLRNRIQLRVDENSSIYYMGATIGNSPVVIISDNTFEGNELRINNFQYNQLINKSYPKNMLTASGKLKLLSNNDILFNNFKIKTNQPTDARIFNIIFRKPFMKQGVFTSDMSINGKASAPIVFGKLKITNINMPLLDATINDIVVNCKKDKIYMNLKGKILSNSLNAYAIMRNNLKPPFIFDDIRVNLHDLDFNKITDALREYDVNTAKNRQATSSNIVDLSQILIKKSEFTADNIKIKNLQANDFVSHVSLDEKMRFDVKDFRFTMADGTIFGNIKYNLLSNNANLAMKVKNANAQILADTLFDLHGQVYGNITGDINLYCNIKSHDSCTQTLGGNVNFDVAHGKMPKLGSLEYLLKAGDLVKGGVTGLSIKGIIDLITPYKTGEFDDIRGNIKIANGIAHDIQIYSAGKALNMYMRGSYNFVNLIADMQIFGALTKNFSTALGKIGNASLNTLFNTIPGINISEAPSVITEDIKKIPNTEGNSYRIFNAVIYGDINGNDYVQSFKWLK